MTDNISEKLDIMIEHLERMDRRDRIRTWGGLVRTLIGLIPMIIFLWSIWYFTQHTDEIITKIGQESAKAAAQFTTDKSGEFMKEIQKMIPTKK